MLLYILKIIIEDWRYCPQYETEKGQIDAEFGPVCPNLSRLLM